MAWTDVSSNSATWDEGKGASWDSGASLWDYSGNVATSFWDVTETTWTGTTDTGNAWAAA